MGKKYFSGFTLIRTLRRKNLIRVQSGFTLIELLIVISIVALLALLIINLLVGQIRKGNDAKRKADLDRIKIAVEEYEKDHNCYPPPDLMLCDQPPNDPGSGLRPYLNKIPCDPITKASYYYDYDDSNVCWFRVYTVLSDTSGGPMGPDGAFNYYVSSPNAPFPQLMQVDNLFGCRSGACVPVYLNSRRGGPECDPTYRSSDCYDQCDIPTTECVTWKQ